MPKYRRLRISGGTYFFTVNLANRRSHLLVEHFDLLCMSVRKTKERHPFFIHGWVVLPNHLHCIWRLPVNDHDYSGRWWAIKNHFSRSLRKSYSFTDKHIWQKRFWEHAVRDQTDFINHLNYIHFNPVKHGFVRQVRHWPFSSFHHLVARGLYPKEWCGGDEYIQTHVNDPDPTA